MPVKRLCTEKKRAGDRESRVDLLSKQQRRSDAQSCVRSRGDDLIFADKSSWSFRKMWEVLATMDDGTWCAIFYYFLNKKRLMRCGFLSTKKNRLFIQNF